MAINDGQLHLIIDSGNFDTLLGEVESAEFECKAHPYTTDTDSGKRELAKDVSAFANASGGYIFIGVKTKPSATHFGDEVEAIRPFVQTLVNTSQYLDILRAWVFPEISGIDVSWVATSGDQTRGLVIVKIPKQPVGLGPFLITRTLDGLKQVETVFGYASRKGDKNRPLEVKELQSYLRSGIHYQDRIDGQLNSILGLLRESVERSTGTTVQQAKVEQVEARISRAIEHGNLKDGRLFVISAQPSEQRELKTIFMSGAGTIRHTLEHPPSLRQHGWDMGTLDQAKIQRGEFIRVVNGTRIVIDLYRDGTLIFAATADSNFLAWGRREESRKINPLALIEVVYGFVNLYQRVILDFPSPPEKVIFRVDFRNMHLDGVKNFLVPGTLGSMAQQFEMDKMEAPDNNGSLLKTFMSADFDVAVIAYEVAREIYLWFGLDETAIPYAKDVDGIRIIDAEAIRANK